MCVPIDTMDKWDEEKLRSVILSKHGNPRTTTDVGSFCSSDQSEISLFYLCRLYASISSRPSRHRGEFPKLRLIPTQCTNTTHYRFGWFWQCPNGDSCQYRHALPPGFVLKSQKKALEEAERANTISLEEFLEVEVRPICGCPCPTKRHVIICAATQTWVQSDASHA